MRILPRLWTSKNEPACGESEYQRSPIAIHWLKWPWHRCRSSLIRIRRCCHDGSASCNVLSLSLSVASVARTSSQYHICSCRSVWYILYILYNWRLPHLLASSWSAACAPRQAGHRNRAKLQKQQNSFYYYANSLHASLLCFLYVLGATMKCPVTSASRSICAQYVLALGTNSQNT